MDEAFPLEGAIDPASFPYLVFNLHRQSATGSLKVQGPAYHKALYFRSGRLLFASSNDPGDQLGSILVETDKITQEQLDDVNSKVGPGNPLAKLLSESGIVSQRELAEAARSKVEKILFDVVAYETGTFEFEDGVLPKGAVDLKLATERVAMAAVRRIEDREFVLRHLGGLDVLLTQTSDEVTDESAMLAAQFDGQRSLKEAASLAAMEEFDAAKVACAMLFLGWAEASGDEPAANRPEPEPDMEIDFETQGPGEADETVMLGTAGVPQIDTAATMADADTEASWPGKIAGEEESPAAEPAWPGAVAEPEPEPEPKPEPEPEPTQTWPTAFADDEESPGSDADAVRPTAFADDQESPGSDAGAAWPTGVSADEEAPTIISSPAPPDPAAARRAKPTTEDLAALDALLSSKSGEEGPLVQIGKEASPDWQPQFLGQGSGSAGRGGRATAPGGRSKLGIVIGVIAALAVVGGGGAYWYFMMGPASAAQVAAVGSSTIATQPPAPTTTGTDPATDRSAEGATSASGAATEAVVPQPEPEPETEAKPNPPATTASAQPKTAKPTAAAAGSLEDARRALRGGQLDPAARAFATHAKGSGTHTLQVLVACVGETVTKAINSVDDPALFIVPLKLNGRSCYRVCFGLFDSEAAAQAAAGSVPAYFKDGGSRPRVVTTASILE